MGFSARLSARALATCALGIACSAAVVCQSVPAWAAGPLDDLAARSSVGSMFYFHLPLGSSETVRGGTFSFVVNNDLASSYPAFQHEKGLGPDHAITRLNLMNLQLSLSGRFRSLALSGLTALGNGTPEK